MTRAIRASQALLISGAAALATGAALWKLWWWAGYPVGVFTPGLDGHRPVASLVARAWLAPSGAYPANLGAGQGGTNFWGILPVSARSDTVARERLVWAAQRNGALELSPRLPPGRYAVVGRAGAQATDGAASLVVRLGAERALDVPLESAMPPVWREHDYRAEVDWRGGRLPIRVELGRISRQNPTRFAYVDAIVIRRLAP